MKLRLAFASIVLLSTTAQTAGDMLPLKRGIYVRVGTACEGASNVDTLSYWGGDNGINSQQTSCKIGALSRNGSIYTIKRTCTSLRFGDSSEDEAQVTISDPKSFTFSNRFWIEARSFRYCGPTVRS